MDIQRLGVMLAAVDRLADQTAKLPVDLVRPALRALIVECAHADLSRTVISDAADRAIGSEHVRAQLAHLGVQAVQVEDGPLWQ